MVVFLWISLQAKRTKGTFKTTRAIQVKRPKEPSTESGSSQNPWYALDQHHTNIAPGGFLPYRSPVYGFSLVALSKQFLWGPFSQKVIGLKSIWGVTARWDAVCTVVC